MLAAELLVTLCLTVQIVSGYKSWNGTNICCDGTVADISMDCCGSKVFDPKEMVCCNNQLLPIPKDQDTEEFNCCVGKQTAEIYNTRTSICCGGVISNVLPGINAKNQYGCCDDPVTNKSQPYITYFSECCRGVILEKKYAGGDSVCCGEELITNPVRCRFNYDVYENIVEEDILSCCGDAQIYNPRTQACGYLYNKTSGKETFKVLNYTENSAVCGLEIINTTTHRCCNDKIIPQADINFSCCYVDSSAYDRRTQFCNETGVSDLDQTVIDTYKKYIDLCGPSFPPNMPFYPPKLETFVYSAFNLTHICCNGAFGENTKQCCGAGVYDPSNSICCGGMSFDMPPGYNRWNYGCCESSDGKTSKIYEVGNSLCCQGKVINSTSSLCCDGNVFAKEDSSKYYTCCGGQQIATNINGNRTQLCASSFNITTFKFNYRVLDVQNDNTASCGLNQYDTLKEGCCNENVYTLTPFSQCCNAAGAVFNNKTQLCIGSTISDMDSGIANCGPSFFPMNFQNYPPIPIIMDNWPSN